MCGAGLTYDVPSTTTTLVVTHTHESDRWLAQVCSRSILAEGDWVDHGSVAREFGPFDTASDVLQWAYQQAAVFIKSMDRMGGRAPQGPPQGRDEPSANR